MKVLIPHKKDPNPYLDEIEVYARTHFNHGNLHTASEEYVVINIHWPEALIDWRIPSEEDFQMISSKLKEWKQHSKIIYTRHDSDHNFNKNPIYRRLFRLIEDEADGFIHLGEYSRNEMKQVYPEKIHVVIPHPLYEQSFIKYDKEYARKQLGIASDSLVMIAPGRIRSVQERDLVLSAFKEIPGRKKTLLNNRMLPFQSDLKFKGKHKLNKLVNIDKIRVRYLNSKYQPPRYIFNYGFIDFKSFSYMMSASDIVFIPRIDILNSGNVFLGFTYCKPLTAAASGNITEQLKEFGFPVFDPGSSKSLRNAVVETLEMSKRSNSGLYGSSLYKYKPSQVAARMDQFFENLKDI